MVESFKNLFNILRDWAKIRYEKLLFRHWTGARSKKKREKAIQYTNSLSRQSSQTEPSTKLVLLCLEFNKPNKQNVYYFNPFKKIVYEDWCQE